MRTAIGVIIATLALIAGVPAAAHNSRPGCPKTFTVPMVKRAIYWTYRGTRNVTRRERRIVARIVRCERFPRSEKYVQRIAQRVEARWRHRRYEAAHPWLGPVLASWYYDAGLTACGFHATYGFASLFLPCGARIEMTGPNGQVVTATMQDHGPYIAGRTFDLNPALKAALGCGDLCDVRWRSP